MVTTLPSGTPLQGGRYRVERVLGQGGFGITYLAMHTGFGQKVALKEFFMKELCVRNEDTSRVTLGSEASSATVGRFREKFLKEARNLFRLNHKHIVRVLDIFEENGTAYFAMEYAEGGSLSEKVKMQGALPEAVATRYIQQVAEALAYLHEQKMNHLDVKPANIMLSSKDNAVLIDFGLAKQYDAAGSQTSTTPAGISEGYAPMEQYKLGGVAEFTPETDIYALGATFFKLLTGVTPPSASDVYEDGVPVETLRQHNVSEAAISVIEQAMNPSKKKRMNSAKVFVATLQKVKAVTGSAASPKSFIDKDATIVSEISSDTKLYVDGHEYVDLGLPSGTLWATCNVGALKPEDLGDSFAWGETLPKEDYSYQTYKWIRSYFAEEEGYCKYMVPRKYDKGFWYNFCKFIGGTPACDNKSVLDPEDDAATVNWGRHWCMPTKQQIEELLNECIWKKIVDGNTIYGFEVKSKKNGRSIFFPVPGRCEGSVRSYVESYGGLWSRSLASDYYKAYSVDFKVDSDSVCKSEGCRYYGLSVRPVCQKYP